MEERPDISHRRVIAGALWLGQQHWRVIASVSLAAALCLIAIGEIWLLVGVTPNWVTEIGVNVALSLFWIPAIPTLAIAETQRLAHHPSSSLNIFAAMGQQLLVVALVWWSLVGVSTFMSWVWFFELVPNWMENAVGVVFSPAVLFIFFSPALAVAVERDQGIVSTFIRAFELGRHNRLRIALCGAIGLVIHFLLGLALATAILGVDSILATNAWWFWAINDVFGLLLLSFVWAPLVVSLYMELRTIRGETLGQQHPTPLDPQS